MKTEGWKAIQTEKITVAELVYDIYFAIMLFAKGIGLYEGQKAYTICLLVSTFLLAVKLVITKHSVLEYIIIGLLGGMGCIIFFYTGEKSALIYILMIIGMKGVSTKRVFKVGLCVWGGTFFAQVLLSLLGLRADIFYIHKKLGVGHLIRWSLGYPHPNVLHISYFILIAFILYFVRAEQKNLEKIIAIMFLGNIYIFAYSLSYTGFALTTIFLAIYYYFAKRKKLSKTEGALIQCVFPACFLFSVVGPLVIKGKLFDILNKILNTRFFMSKYFLTTQKLELFGTTAFDLPDYSYNLDCSYVNALFYHGIIPTLCMFVGYIFLVRYLYKENRRKELAITLGIVIAGISEPFLVNTSYKNVTFLFMGEMLFAMTQKYAVSGKIVFLNRAFSIIPIGEKECSIGTKRIKRTCRNIVWKMKYVCSRYRRWLILTALLVFWGTTAGYLMAADIPDRVYALLWSCDRKEDAGQAPDANYVYLDIEQLPENFNGRILNYKDKETPLYAFDRITVQFEYGRKAISYGMIVACMVSVLMILGFGIRLREIGDLSDNGF